MSDIVLQNLSLSIGNTTILSDISENIYSGELYCIMGKSGSGKTAVLKALNGLYTDVQGLVQFDGNNIYNFNTKDMLRFHRKCGFVFQNAALISSMSVMENLSLSFYYHAKISENDTLSMIEPHLEFFGLSKKILKSNPSYLSPGEKIIICTIRALLKNPDFFFWDEPIANLDSITRDKIIALILKLKKLKKTNIIVTNSSGFALKYADHIGILDEGVLIASGTPSDLKKKKNPVVKNLLKV